MSPPRRTRARAAFCLVAVVLISGLPVPGIARELRLREFQAELEVLPDSSLNVTETITAQFIGTWQGLYRTIPVEYPSPGGFNYSLQLTDVSASAGGDVLEIEKSRSGANLELRIHIPGASDATRTVRLRYRVRNALRFFDSHDELYWNVTGNDWEVPIGSASASVILPANVTGVRVTSFTGTYGVRGGDARVTPSSRGVEVAASRLGYREGLTIVVGWDKGFVSPPTPWARAMLFATSNWPLLAPIAAFVLMFWAWHVRGRDPKVGAVVVQYEPPAGLTPAEVGTLIDDSADIRDITATIVDLAVRGYLVIEEEQEQGLFGSSTKYVLHLQKKRLDWTGVKPHERLLLGALFTADAPASVKLDDLRNRFYQSLPGIRDALFDQLRARGYFAYRPDRVRQGFVAAGVVAGVLLFGGGQVAASQLGMQPQPFVIAAVMTAVVVCAFGWFMPARTVAGAQARRSALGFEDFLSHVEADRLQRIQQTPQTFEKYLPFAMALGVEKAWAAAFAAICTEPPAWYHGPSGIRFEPRRFGDNVSRMSTSFGQVMTSSPRSSSGASGFGGSGSSGGGFGGGGGGGF